MKRIAARGVAVGSGALLVALMLPASGALAAPPGGCENRNNNTYDKLLGCVTLEGVREHQQALQEIAEKNHDPFYPGTRADGTDGYSESVEYVSGVLEKAGYQVTTDDLTFDFQFPAVLRQLTPVAAEYETGPFTGTGSGTVEGPVIPVDINLTGDRASTSGCEASDFAGIDWSGPADIALIQRGTCFFGTKAFYAEQAGAEAVVIFNQGNAPDRLDLIVADATSVDPPIPGAPGPVTHGIPVVGASFDQGVALAAAGSTAFVEVVPAESRTEFSVIAELPGKNANNVVMAGAHLDSVTEGPGINDDGSGTAALLETAQMMAKSHPENTLRFGFWAGEELGLLGSTDYVTGLSQPERDRIALYMNYDMIGSPNYIQMVYDADQSSFPADGVPIPPGSVAIEDLYESYYTSIGEPYDDTAFDGRSDYQAFIDNGIPSGGLFTGAEVLKTEEQAAIWGGTAGEAFDPCYHQACDTVDNVDLHALEVNSDLVAYAMLTFAYSTESVNGVPGKAVPGAAPLPAPAGAKGTFV